MSSTAFKPNKFNEVYESANRLRTVPNAPNPFVIRDSKTGELRKSDQTEKRSTSETVYRKA